MNPEIKEKWLVALKSGEYKKGQGRLKKNVGNEEFSYCCLGVLCDLHKKETGKGNWGPENDYRVDNGDELNDRSRYWPPKKVVEWAGLSDHSGEFTPERNIEDSLLESIGKDFGNISLAHVNDNKTYDDTTFNTVIKYIEKYF